MKKILSLVLIVMVFTACTNNEKKAKKLIKEYLKTSMNDFSSYEPVEFSKLDSTFSYYRDTDEGKKLKGQLKSTMESWQWWSELAQNASSPTASEVYLKYSKENGIKYDSLQNLDSIAEQSFKPEHIGYAMSHKFRGKNALGAIMLNESGFYFDKDLTKVTDVIDINDEFEKFRERLERINRKYDSD
jgi:hypothetical protein